MRRYLVIFIALFACCFIVTSLLTNKSVSAIDKEIDGNLELIIEQMDKNIAAKTAVSSNPYDYIKDNNAFEEIVSLGNVALPALDSKLSKSDNYGFKEYFLAIAIERIAKVDLKKNKSTFWDRPEGFVQQWSKYLQAIPQHVDEISNDASLSRDEKVDQLIELGTPAVPFILDKVELGNEGLFPALVVLTKNSKKEAPEGALNKKEWASNNKSLFEELRHYVLDKKERTN